MKFITIVLLLGIVTCAVVLLLNRSWTGIWGCVVVLAGCGCGLFLFYNIQLLKDVNSVFTISALSAVLMITIYLLVLAIEKRYRHKKKAVQNNECVAGVVKCLSVLPENNMFLTEMEQAESVKTKPTRKKRVKKKEGAVGGDMKTEQADEEPQTMNEPGKTGGISSIPAAEEDHVPALQADDIVSAEESSGNKTETGQAYDEPQTMNETGQTGDIPKTPAAEEDNVPELQADDIVSAEESSGNKTETGQAYDEPQTMNETGQTGDIPKTPAAEEDNVPELQADDIVSAEESSGNKTETGQAYDEPQTMNETGQTGDIPKTPAAEEDNVPELQAEKEAEADGLHADDWRIRIQLLMAELALLPVEEKYRTAQYKIREMLRDGYVLSQENKQQLMLILKLLREKRK